MQDLDVGEEDRLAMEAMMDMSDNFDMPSSSAMVQPMHEEDEAAGRFRITPGSRLLPLTCPV